MTQRRQQAEQQINRVLSNLSDLYEQKQLLEHDLRRLEERAQHFDATEESRSEGGGYEDELKADFVDLVDQHTGRHSILQMQANNVFPSITADFYQMSGLDDLQDGSLKDLPENEKAVLRKKWKLYEQWKDQFETAVKSRLNDVERQLTSVQASIEQTQKWLQPYVEDMERIQPDGQFEDGGSCQSGAPVRRRPQWRTQGRSESARRVMPVSRSSACRWICRWTPLRVRIISDSFKESVVQFRLVETSCAGKSNSIKPSLRLRLIKRGSQPEPHLADWLPFVRTPY
jgi:hypothetical protein